jgi:hypothetical protein
MPKLGSCKMSFHPNGLVKRKTGNLIFAELLDRDGSELNISFD